MSGAGSARRSEAGNAVSRKKKEGHKSRSLGYNEFRTVEVTFKKSLVKVANTCSPEELSWDLMRCVCLMFLPDDDETRRKRADWSE